MAKLTANSPDLALVADVEMGSFNHSYLQVRLGKLLDNEQYTACAELSLDLSHLDLEGLELKNRDEVKPDLCLFPKRGLSRPRDVLRMREVPLLAVEILSPRQGSDEILEKFQIYFALGIRSCWLVDPTLEAVAIYTSLTTRQVFSAGVIQDPILDIQIEHGILFQ